MARTTNSMSFIVDNVQYTTPDQADPTAWVAEPKGEPEEHVFPKDIADRYHDMYFDYDPEQ